MCFVNTCFGVLVFSGIGGFGLQHNLQVTPPQRKMWFPVVSLLKHTSECASGNGAANSANWVYFADFCTNGIAKVTRWSSESTTFVSPQNPKINNPKRNNGPQISCEFLHAPHQCTPWQPHSKLMRDLPRRLFTDSSTGAFLTDLKLLSFQQWEAAISAFGSVSS